MKLKTDYDEMSEQELVAEIDRRCDAFGDQLPTYVDAALVVSWGGGNICYEFSEGNSIVLSSVQDPNRTVNVPSTSRLYKGLLLRFLQRGVFIVYRFNVEAETLSQEEALKDIEE